MSKTYQLHVQSGYCDKPLAFATKDINNPKRYRFNTDELSEFTTMQAMSHGAWLMQNGSFGFEVMLEDVVKESDCPALLIVSNVFESVTMRLHVDEPDNVPETPEGADKWLSPASFLLFYGNEAYWKHVDHWRKEEFSPEGIISELDSLLQSDEMPWLGVLFLKGNREVVVEDLEYAGESKLMARCWTFWDEQASQVYVTAEGLKDPTTFDEYMAAYAPYSRTDPDLGVRLISTVHH